MKNSKIHFALAIVMLLTNACKKGDFVEPKSEPPVKTQKKYLDSIYFKVDGVDYQGDGTNSFGVSNSQTNLKPFANELPGRNYAIATGRMFWYGDIDSTLYGIHHKINLNNGNAEIFFTKKMLTSKLTQDISVKIYQNNEDFFKVGERTFSTDYEMENSTDGIVLEVNDANKFKSALTSSRPGFSILIRPNIGTDIQKDSKFEIIKAEKLSDNIVLIQAKFELNLYDADGNKHKVTDGFYQKLIKRQADNWWQLQVW